MDDSMRLHNRRMIEALRQAISMVEVFEANGLEAVGEFAVKSTGEAPRFGGNLIAPAERRVGFIGGGVDIALPFGAR